ncbi:MAG: DNA polymerase IV [Gemmataceae bacterium]
MPPPLTILHVDMDAFYASVEERDRPELRGLPIIVGGLGKRGVVSAASYAARKFGVHSAMPMATARRRCPQGVYLPTRMGHYAAISRQIRDIFLAFTPLVEPLSLDEAFLDVAGCEQLFGPAEQMARAIKARIRAETGLAASVGVAPNKFLAKLASDHGKPDGFIVIEPERVTDFLAPLPVERLWGVGNKGRQRLHALGIRTVAQLAALDEGVVVHHFGEAGRHLRELAQGRDDRRVVPDREARSLSTETTFADDIGDREVLRGCLLDLVDHLASRLRHHQLRAKTVEVKIRSSEFRTSTRSHALPEATDVTDIIWQTAAALLECGLTPDLLPVRLLGVGASRLTQEEVVQRDMFETNTHQRQAALDQVVDAIRDQFGGSAIRRGSRLNSNQQ